MKKFIKKQKNNTLICFYFKINNSKLNNQKKTKTQILKITKRLKEKYNIKTEKINYKIGTVGDDFIYNRFRLEISFDCSENI